MKSPSDENPKDLTDDNISYNNEFVPAGDYHDMRIIWSQILILFDPVLNTIEGYLSLD